MQIQEQIASGRTAIGIEFGSTHIKAVLIGENFSPIASGVHDWNNRLENGIWTYSEDDIRGGLQACFADLMRNTEQQFGVKLTTAGSIGISAMMHGDDKEYWYRMGYRDGYNAGGEDEADFRRMRDSRGRFV